MITVLVQPPRWPRQRWAIAVAAVFLLQVLLVFWLSDRSPPSPRTIPPAPVLRLVPDNSNGWLALQNPTLFGLPPQRHGFSGAAWLEVQTPHFEPVDPPEPLRWLALSAEALVGGFRHFMATNAIPPFPTILLATPALTLPALAAPEPILPPSVLRLEGGLARRRLLEEIPLPTQTNQDLVAPSCVQVLVNEAGRVLSPPVLLPADKAAPPGLRSTEADQLALRIARTARFKPAPGLTLGQMIFEWQTVPPPVAP